MLITPGPRGLQLLLRGRMLLALLLQQRLHLLPVLLGLDAWWCATRQHTAVSSSKWHRSSFPCNIRREGVQSLVILEGKGVHSLVILEGRESVGGGGHAGRKWFPASPRQPYRFPPVPMIRLGTELDVLEGVASKLGTLG